MVARNARRIPVTFSRQCGVILWRQCGTLLSDQGVAKVLQSCQGVAKWDRGVAKSDHMSYEEEDTCHVKVLPSLIKFKS